MDSWKFYNPPTSTPNLLVPGLSSTMEDITSGLHLLLTAFGDGRRQEPWYYLLQDLFQLLIHSHRRAHSIKRHISETAQTSMVHRSMSMSFRGWIPKTCCELCSARNIALPKSYSDASSSAAPFWTYSAGYLKGRIFIACNQTKSILFIWAWESPVPAVHQNMGPRSLDIQFNTVPNSHIPMQELPNIVTHSFPYYTVKYHVLY